MTISKPRSGHVQLQAIIHSNLKKDSTSLSLEFSFCLIHFFFQNHSLTHFLSLSHTYTLICFVWLDTKTLKKFNSKGTRLSLIFLLWIDGRPGRMCVVSGLYRLYWKKGEESVWKWHLIKEGDKKRLYFDLRRKMTWIMQLDVNKIETFYSTLFSLSPVSVCSREWHAHYTM